MELTVLSRGQFTYKRTWWILGATKWCAVNATEPAPVRVAPV